LTNTHFIWILKAFWASQPKRLWFLSFLSNLLRFKGYATRLLILNNNMIQIVTAPNIKGVALENELKKIGTKSRRLFSSFFSVFFWVFDIERKLWF
jgi:hypothetical protein